MFEWLHWAGFGALIAVVLVIDLGVFHRRAHEVPFREALAWTGAWVGLAVLFAGSLLLWQGGRVAGEFLAGYLIEWSLSVDNVFVFLLIFAHFAVPGPYRHRVLFWGVVGAIVLRLGFILAGAALIHRFHWLLYVFGALLLVTAIRFLRHEGSAISIERSRSLRLVRRVVPMTDGYRGQRLVVREAGRRLATPLLAVLVVIEATDVVFAIDSIPAIFAVTSNAFIVFASNALALLGLRSLSFVLSGALARFRHLRRSLAALLAFVGVKMLLAEVVHVPVAASLAAIVLILSLGVVASLRSPSQAPVHSGGDGGPAGDAPRAP